MGCALIERIADYICQDLLILSDNGVASPLLFQANIDLSDAIACPSSYLLSLLMHLHVPAKLASIMPGALIGIIID